MSPTPKEYTAMQATMVMGERTEGVTYGAYRGPRAGIHEAKRGLQSTNLEGKRGMDCEPLEGRRGL